MNGADLQHIRKKLKFTQNEFAELLGVTQPFISQVEQGRNAVTDKMIESLKSYIDENELPIVIAEEPELSYSSLHGKKNDCPELQEFTNADRKYRIPEDNAIAGYRPGTILALKELQMKNYIPLGILYLIETLTDRLEILRYIVDIDHEQQKIRIALDLNGRFEQDFPFSEIRRIYAIKSFFTQKL